MKRIALPAVVFFGIASFACGGESQPSNGAASDSEAAGQASPSPEPVVIHGPDLVALDETLDVDAVANIYGAGYPYPAPDPGGGGGGILPPGWKLPPGAAGRVVTFPTVTGRVTPINGTAALHGPEGTKEYQTSVNSYRGISGIDHEKRQMFLVGVFLTKAPPKDPPPPTLDFTKPPPGDLIAPHIGQVFLIGDGKDFRYKVPRGASRLFLGFADGAYGRGPVGYYGNNAGELKVMVSISG